MAIIRNNRYPGRFEAPSTNSPQGAFKNRSAPGAQDGSYLEKDWANDWDGFFARVLNVAGVTPNGNVDTGTSSQLYDALLQAMPGRLIGRRVFTSNGTYTPTNGTRLIIVEAVGGGGAGGGAITTSTGVSAGSGGASGSYGKSQYTSGFNSVAVTIGAGGASVSGGNGGNGGTTSFGSLLVCPGGGGGPVGVASNSQFIYGSQGAPGAAASGTGLIVASRGQPGFNSIANGINSSPLGGLGAPSHFGGGAPQSVNVDNTTGAGSPGAGGGGVANGVSQAAHFGSPGAAGIVIVWEYS